VEEPFDVALEDVSYLLCGTADSQQTGTDSSRAAARKPPNVFQYAAVLQRLYTRIGPHNTHRRLRSRILQINIIQHSRIFIRILYIQARREPLRGPGKHSRGAPKHFHGVPLGRKFLNFSFQNGTLWRTLYFWLTVGPPNVAGPGVANPLPHSLDVLVYIPISGDVHYERNLTIVKI